MVKDSDMISEWAQKGAAFGDCGRMCNDCAFKKGTEANNEEYTTAMAAQAVAFEMSKFVCHKEDKGKLMRLDIPCVGFLYAKQYFENRFKK